MTLGSRTERPTIPGAEIGGPWGLGGNIGFSFSHVAGDARGLVSREMEDVWNSHTRCSGEIQV